MLTVTDIQTNIENKICLKHEVNGPSSVNMMITKFGTLLLYSSQSVYPSLHIDRCIIMPEVIRSQMCELMESMGYLLIRTVLPAVITGTIIPYVLNSNATRDLDIRIKSVSMGRSTLNVTMIEHDEGQLHKIVP